MYTYVISALLVIVRYIKTVFEYVIYHHVNGTL